MTSMQAGAPTQRQRRIACRLDCIQLDAKGALSVAPTAVLSRAMPSMATRSKGG
jgi:hypothetical protein